MNWTTWPYWVRGGVLLAALYVFALAFAFLYALTCTVWFCELLSLEVAGYLSPVGFFLEQLPFIRLDWYWPTVIIIVQIIVYFFVGAMGGWLYGKIKKPRP